MHGRRRRRRRRRRLASVAAARHCMSCSAIGFGLRISSLRWWLTTVILIINDSISTQSDELPTMS